MIALAHKYFVGEAILQFAIPTIDFVYGKNQLTKRSPQLLMLIGAANISIWVGCCVKFIRPDEAAMTKKQYLGRSFIISLSIATASFIFNEIFIMQKYTRRTISLISIMQIVSPICIKYLKDRR